jgi:hypothetical protein
MRGVSVQPVDGDQWTDSILEPLDDVAGVVIVEDGREAIVYVAALNLILGATRLGDRPIVLNHGFQTFINLDDDDEARLRWAAIVAMIEGMAP